MPLQRLKDHILHILHVLPQELLTGHSQELLLRHYLHLETGDKTKRTEGTRLKRDRHPTAAAAAEAAVPPPGCQAPVLPWSLQGAMLSCPHAEPGHRTASDPLLTAAGARSSVRGRHFSETQLQLSMERCSLPPSTPQQRPVGGEGTEPGPTGPTWWKLYQRALNYQFSRCTNTRPRRRGLSTTAPGQKPFCYLSLPPPSLEIIFLTQERQGTRESLKRPRSSLGTGAPLGIPCKERWDEMAVAHWFVLLMAGCSQPPFMVTPVCRGQDPAVPLRMVRLAMIPRGGTQLP